MIVELYLDRVDEIERNAAEWLERAEPLDAMIHACVTTVAAIADLRRGRLARTQDRVGEARAMIDCSARRA